MLHVKKAVGGTRIDKCGRMQASASPSRSQRAEHFLQLS